MGTAKDNAREFVLNGARVFSLLEPIIFLLCGAVLAVAVFGRVFTSGFLGRLASDNRKSLKKQLLFQFV